MSARTAWVYIAAATWLAAVWLGLLGGCGAGAAGGDDPGGSGSTADAAPVTAGIVTTVAPAPPGASTTISPQVDTSGPGTPGPGTTLGLRPNSVVDLSAEIRGLLGESGVPIYLPRALPSGYAVAESSLEDQVPGKGNPAAWQLGGTSPGPRAAGYAVLYTDGAHTIRLDVNPAADLGDVQWADAGTNGVYGPLRTTTAADTTWVSVADPDGVEIIVSGATGLSRDLLFLASKVARVD